MTAGMFASPRVLGTAEARKQLPAILDRCRHEGLDADPVFLGSYRDPAAVILSAAIVEQLAPYLEDLLLAERIRARVAESGEPVPAHEVISRLGIDSGELEAEKRAIRRELGVK